MYLFKILRCIYVHVAVRLLVNVLRFYAVFVYQ